MDAGHDVTDLLVAWREGNQDALAQLIPLVHDELQRIAHVYLASERSGHTLRTTDLVNETYLRLVNSSRVNWQDRAQFFAAAAGSMRRILVDHARRQLRQKRGSGGLPVELNESLPAPGTPVDAVDALDLDRALQKLEQLDPDQARIVELRFFGGLTVEETAASLSISPATVKREWALAKGWLFRELSGNHGGS